MSFFSWFMRKPPAKRRLPEPPGLLNAGASVLPPARAHKPAASSTPPEKAAGSKNERMERRELLYIVVRDAMVCAGVLSASYKFKVLSLDPRGQQFLVMMDLAREFAGETVRLSEIEGLIAQTAKARYSIAVTAVYWRINDQVAEGIAQKGVAPHGASLPHLHPPQPAPRAPVAARTAAAHPALARNPAPAPQDGAPAAAAVRLVAPRFDPIEADEVTAFKQALASASATRGPGSAAPGMPVRSGPRHNAPANTHNSNISSDFADTVMPDQDSRAQSLSNTQYGEL